MKHLSILAAIILAAAALVASFQNCYACTGITLKAKDGSTVVARTIERNIENTGESADDQIKAY